MALRRAAWMVSDSPTPTDIHMTCHSGRDDGLAVDLQMPICKSNDRFLVSRGVMCFSVSLLPVHPFLAWFP
ncbi:hypothetical protein [Lysobacter fragariae]